MSSDETDLAMTEPESTAPRYPEVIVRLHETYDRTADDRNERSAAKESWKVSERAAFLERLRAEGARRLLEIGAGTGQDAAFFRDAGLQVIATDLSPRMVEHCLAKGLDARVADFLHLGVPAGSVDAVYALNCLLHVPNADLGAVLASVKAALRPAGLFFVGVYGGRSHEGVSDWDELVPPRFFALRTDSDLLGAVSSHFEVADFHAVPLKEPDFYFQSLTLRKPSA